MPWFLGGSLEPRLEGHRIPQTGWLNRWLLRNPIRGPVICFVIAGVTLGLSFINGTGGLVFLSIPTFLLGLFLIIYALLRRSFEPPSSTNYDQMDESPEEYIEVNEQARQRAVAKWRRRARDDRRQHRNPGG